MTVATPADASAKPPFWVAAWVIATVHFAVVGLLFCYFSKTWMLPETPSSRAAGAAMQVLSFPAGLLIERLVDEHPASLLLLPMNSILWGYVLERLFGKWLPLHFSLRTMLIAMMLVAVVLGLGVWAAS